LKSSEFMQRLERAGWKRIRQDGSHFTYERDGKKVTYYYGRPQTVLGKVKLLHEERRFDLKRIEKEQATERAARVAASAQRAERKEATTMTAIAEATKMEPVLNHELSYREMHILYAQLNRDHGVSITQLVAFTGIGHQLLHEYMHQQKPSLSKPQLTVLRDWFLAQEVKHGLTRDRAELLKRGYGARTGSINARDNRLPIIATALKATDRTFTDLNKEIFGKSSGGGIVGAVARGAVKRVTPQNMEKLEAWYQNWLSGGPQPEPKPEPEVRTEVVPAAHGYGIPKPEAEKQFGPPMPLSAFLGDPESRAVTSVWLALAGLDGKAKTRVLTYTLNRVEEEGE